MRPAASLDDVIEQMQWGDVVLFRCRMTHTAVVRAVTLANYDHVAVVVVDRDCAASGAGERVNGWAAPGEGG